MATAPSVYVVQLLFHRNATFLKNTSVNHHGVLILRFCLYAAMKNLPVQYVVTWHRRRIRVTCVLHQETIVGFQQLLGHGHAPVQVLLVGLFSIHADHYISSADETHLWGVVVESHHLQHVTHAVSIQPSEGSDDGLIEATELDMYQIHELIIWNITFIKVHQQFPVMSERKELKVAHVRQEGKSNIPRITKRFQINPKVALR
ncbi:hypothetical protein V8G54_028595 [Vigna mungo]|uniref:Uncharacterized protein n=1 Tax=Vigna mungo TaxID=3915 RepID=A0AAQ3MRQ7_VIGMU